jgi:hypothetical protein
MYLTQSSFLGKTGPLDPSRVIPDNPPTAWTTYPNRWNEDRNLKSLHHRFGAHSLSEQKSGASKFMQTKNN